METFFNLKVVFILWVDLDDGMSLVAGKEVRVWNIVQQKARQTR